MEHFDELMENSRRHSVNNKYYFIITKPCGYEFIITAYKQQSLYELIRMISCETYDLNPRLSLTKNGEEIPNRDKPLEQFIASNRESLEIPTKPPDPVAYRIWLKCECGCKCKSCR